MFRFNLDDTAMILIDTTVAELVKNWASPAGAVAFPLLT